MELLQHSGGAGGATAPAPVAAWPDLDLTQNSLRFIHSFIRLFAIIFTDRPDSHFRRQSQAQHIIGAPPILPIPPLNRGLHARLKGGGFCGAKVAGRWRSPPPTPVGPSGIGEIGDLFQDGFQIRRRLVLLPQLLSPVLPADCSLLRVLYTSYKLPRPFIDPSKPLAWSFIRRPGCQSCPLPRPTPYRSPTSSSTTGTAACRSPSRARFSRAV